MRLVWAGVLAFPLGDPILSSVSGQAIGWLGYASGKNESSFV